MSVKAPLAALPAMVQAAHILDVPRSCTCPWRWLNGVARFERTGHDAGCPWHTAPPRPRALAP